MRCNQCRWWVQGQSTVLGECRRMPPHPIDNLTEPRWWPHTLRNDWCGEFQRPAEDEDGQ